MKQKAKTHRASAKRLRITRTGKVMSNKKANARHLLAHKSRKRKHRLRKSTVLARAAVRNIRRILPYG